VLAAITTARARCIVMMYVLCIFCSLLVLRTLFSTRHHPACNTGYSFMSFKSDNLEVKRLFGRPILILKHNVTSDLKGIRHDIVNWLCLAKDQIQGGLL
jgi:hypothetical protein